ncbi:hypothetical protein MAR_031319 [Mya arenaria]|uniref:Uncharacterized protein n=1 Tax=Mya arenaria TaxID=6604 RepID=A0ABY7F3K7_MYAAR|nr:hypothetical protein MAR_031319 [Mya arenaria]
MTQWILIFVRLNSTIFSMRLFTKEIYKGRIKQLTFPTSLKGKMAT